MGIFDKIKAKHKEKRLIREKDEVIIDALPKEKDNSRIDIKNVVKSMENPQNMYKVVKNNFPEIIEQDNVKNTLEYLRDDDVFKLLEKNHEELRKRSKIVNAIEAIGDNDKKLSAVFNNIRNLEDIELARILEYLSPEKSADEQFKVEQKKIKLISIKILGNIIKYGAAWHLKELTDTLKSEKSKLSVLDLCLSSMKDYEINKNKKIDQKAKEKLVVELLWVTNIKDKQKYNKIYRIIETGMLEGCSAEELKRKLQEKKEEKQDRAH